MDKILIVLLAYVGVAFINHIDLEYQSHYFLSSAFYFAMFMICFKSKDKLIYIYSYLNVLMLFVFVNMLLPSGFIAMEYWVYDSTINLSNIVMSYELLMLVVGALNVLFAVVYRHRNAVNLFNNNHKRV